MNRMEYLYKTLQLNKSIRLLHYSYYNYETNTDKHKRNYVLKYITPWLYQAVLKKEHILFNTIKLIDFRVLDFDQNEPIKLRVTYRNQDMTKRITIVVPSFTDTMRELKMMTYKKRLLKKRGNRYGN